MRTSNYLPATKKETPADATIISHQLMLRAGLIRKVSSGLYSWLPTGNRVLRKVEAIIRGEMNRANAMEVLMPVVQNAELWEESGRLNAFGSELLCFKDRHQRDFILAPTHEEVITDIVRNEINSYKQLPVNFYQIQTKFRDEIRPRFGVMRSREFIMKDAYSFHLTEESLQSEYDNMYRAYCAIFDRLGLDYRAVEADTGSIGGNASHEFHILADSGEDAIIFSDSSNYAANIEKAEAVSLLKKREAPEESLQLIDTPDTKTISSLVEQFNQPVEKTVKTLIVKSAGQVDGDFIALLIRGDHELNEIKAEHLPETATPLQFASEADILAAINAGPGSLGPVNLSVPCIVDHTVAMMNDFSAGANIEDKHYFGINWERDATYLRAADLRNVIEGDPSPDGQGKLFIKRGIEAGHIFQLGQKYSHAMNATALDANGKSQPMYMGCYGIGVTRIIAAAIEQNHDEHGIIWPAGIAPFQVALAGLKIEKSSTVRDRAEALYHQLTDAGIEVLLDDRKASPGVKMADMELIGIPHLCIISERGLNNNIIEYRDRRTGKTREITVEDAAQFLIKLCLCKD